MTDHQASFTYEIFLNGGTSNTLSGPKGKDFLRGLIFHENGQSKKADYKKQLNLARSSAVKRMKQHLCSRHLSAEQKKGLESLMPEMEQAETAMQIGETASRALDFVPVIGSTESVW